MMTSNKPEIIEMDVEKLAVIVRRAEEKALQQEDLETIRAVFESYIYVTQLIDEKSTTIARLRKLLFGSPTEKTAAVIGGANDTSSAAASTESSAEPSAEPAGDKSNAAEGTDSNDEPRSPRKGHGRNGADDYPGAENIEIPHASLQPGNPCPQCEEGTVYEVARPGVVVRFVGQAPLQATVYRLQKLRCNLCGLVFTAKAPEGLGSEKYDETAASMIALLKYGGGFPFNRLDGLQSGMEIPLPASTQWDIVNAAATIVTPAHEELIHQAAQGEVLHNDDTTVKILQLMGERARQRALAEQSEDPNIDPDRTGLFTTAIVATCAGHRMALYISGRQHAGENLRDVLQQRAATLAAPIQMCDALSRNFPGELKTIVANCLAHGRRQFVDVYDRFPDECRHVLEALRVIYKNDKLAREQKLSPPQRLEFHQAESGPSLAQLHDWMTRQFDEKLVEPNSALGSAITYMLKHWEKLTLFLREPGAPLDNNICERALKKAILHRKSALFYKTQHGARVGDLYMSLIHTCELCGANPFDYLTELQRHAEDLVANPANWMPWNYRATVEAAASLAIC